MGPHVTSHGLKMNMTPKGVTILHPYNDVNLTPLGGQLTGGGTCISGWIASS